MKPEQDEHIEKFLLKVQQKAEKCSFGKTEQECRQTAIIDKIIQNASDDLRRKLLEKDNLSLDTCSKIVNAHQSVIYQADQKKSLPAYKDRCSRCGRFRHQVPNRCPALDRKWHRCGNTGHFQSMCKSRAKNVR